jgi:hypothetical protein
MSDDKFNVFLSAMGLPATKENLIPLGAYDAWQLAQSCTQRVAITEVVMVFCDDDAICFHWKDGKVLFP